MKELSIEEKAKRYDEAIKIAKDINDEQRAQPFNVMIKVFPELEGSDDERIRKKLLSSFKGIMADADEDELWYGLPYNDIITWLEKQGKKHLVNYDEAEKEKADFVGDGFVECHADFLDFKEGNIYWLEYIGDDMYNVRSDNLLGKTYHITPCQLYTVFKKLTWIEKQCKKKLAEKYNIRGIKTKHADGKLGEMIKEMKSTDKVEPKFHEGDWILNNVCFPVQIASIEGDMYRFTDGDALSSSFVDENYHLWSIQDAEDGDVLMSESNCGLGTWYCIFKSLDDNESMTVYCYLARDGRFEAKKELCFDKDPFNTKPATKEQCDLLFQKMKEAGYEWDAYKKELKKIEQKPAEWSEDDEQYLLVCKNALRKYEVTDKWDSNIISQWLDNKLRCLRPQEQWKPTKEQLETFDYYLDADISNKDKEILFGLYNDLKQL